MSVTMNKELLVRLPISLYTKIKRLCEMEYRPMSALIRELLVEKLEDSFSKEELKAMEDAGDDFRKGKGVSWRKMKRG